MFNPTSPSTPDPSVTLANHPFYPDIDLADFRQRMRVDGVATKERAEFALEGAIMEVNRRLQAFVQRQESQGITRLLDVAESHGQPAGEKIKLYQRAVYALAKANLIERYRDYDSTAKAQGRADQLDENIDELRRDAAWAINDLVGRPRATVGLL